VDGLRQRVADTLGLEAPLEQWMEEEAVEPEIIEERLTELADAHMAGKVDALDEASWRGLKSRSCSNGSITTGRSTSPRWTRCGRWCSCAYAQKTPINEYKQEAFGLFEKMLDAIREDDAHPDDQRIRMRPADDFQLPELPDFRPATSIRSGENDAVQVPGAADAGRAGRGGSGPRHAARLARKIPSPGRASAATRRAPAVRGRSTSTATARRSDRRFAAGRLHRPAVSGAISIACRERIVVNKAVPESRHGNGNQADGRFRRGNHRRRSGAAER
jgi:preprotein translocase subunit SecA